MTATSEKKSILKWARGRKGQQTLIIIAFMVIPLTLLFVFTYLPFGEMVKFSFYKMKYTTPVDKRVFVGFKNYVEVFQDKVKPLLHGRLSHSACTGALSCHHFEL